MNDKNIVERNGVPDVLCAKCDNSKFMVYSEDTERDRVKVSSVNKTDRTRYIVRCAFTKQAVPSPETMLSCEAFLEYGTQRERQFR